MKHVLNETLAHQRYFEEMTKIPHGSFHEEAYADYLCGFAKEHGLTWIRDEMNNVVIYKQASAGYETHAPVLLQAHIDMVCEKNKEVTFDFETEALRLEIKDGFLHAMGTTLGADDGAGVAYMLALLADKDAKHPPLECAFTVQEEVGLFGAMALKKEYFQAVRMINLDDGGEASTCITSAGGVNVRLCKEAVYVPISSPAYQIALTGLKGGHSGGEIDKERGNANKLLARLLYGIHQRFGVQLGAMEGGVKDNAIPREAFASFCSDAKEELLQAYVKEMEACFQKELEFSDAALKVKLCRAEMEQALSVEDSEELLKLLVLLPNGLRHHSMSIEGLSTASSNLATVHCAEQIEIHCSLRGALESYVEELAVEMECLGEMLAYDTRREAHYPAWSYDENSELRKTMKEVCVEVLGKELKEVAVHGGLECGVFKAMKPEMDIVTMGPKMYDIHTPQERLDLASFDKTFLFLKQLLERL